MENRFDRLERLGLVRFKIEPDECVSVEDLEGDCFNPEVNPDVDPAILASEREAFVDRINREGVWGIIGEYNIGQGWTMADSVWGFVGEDFEGSGYDLDVKDITVDALRKAIRMRCRCCMGKGVKNVF